MTYHIIISNIQIDYINVIKGLSMTIDWTTELENEVIEWISEGKSLQSYCKQEGKVSISSVLRRQEDSEAFENRCERARGRSVEVNVDRLHQINDMLFQGEIDPQAAKVIAANIQWTAAKIKPKRYGDAMTLRGDKDNPIELKLADRLLRAESVLVDITPDNKLLDKVET